MDVLRGVALLGILVMNIQSFSMIHAAYLNPTAYGDLSGANGWVWFLCHVFADQKFMTLFSMLFGAGILLVTQRAEVRGRGAAGLHYRRMFWLLVFGMAHAYLVWHAEILVTYALCGAVAYLFRRAGPALLSILGVGALVVPTALFLLARLTMPFWTPVDIAEIRADWAPAPEEALEELQAYRGGWLAQMARRAPTAFEFQTLTFLFWGGWRAGGLMLLGMALHKWGILTAQRPARIYIRLAIIGCVVGFPLILDGVRRNFAAEWAFEFSLFIGFQFNYWGSLFVSMAYLSAVMLVVQSGILARARRTLAAVGRTALTNYLGQSLVATFIFYGHGLGLFGSVSRVQQVLIVVGIWAVQCVASVLWLRHFRYGPAEWLWRSLTYMQFQRIRLPAPGLERAAPLAPVAPSRADGGQ